MSENIIVSACLLGKNCKYNGKNNFDKSISNFIKDKSVITVCPEVMGGLPTPRVPSEIEFGKNSLDVIELNAIVVSKIGEDVSKEFLLGAEKTLDIAKLNCVSLAILKDGSPSCGCNYIYDGSFSSVKKEGMGITALLLYKNGIKVISENDLEKVVSNK